jgi:hypothetical protein
MHASRRTSRQAEVQAGVLGDVGRIDRSLLYPLVLLPIERESLTEESRGIAAFRR